MGTNTHIYQKDFYIIPDIDYLINTYIREYDMAKANISILLSKGLISGELHNQLMGMRKIDRQIYIGKLMKDNKDIYRALTKGFGEYRGKFFNANNIEEKDVISIKKDAIYLANAIPRNLKFDEVVFAEKSIYTSFYKLGSLEAYYRANREAEVIDIKGISDDKLPLHREHFLEFLCTIFYEIQSGSLTEALSMIQQFNNKYISLELDIGYYRSFDSNSMYNVKQSGFSTMRAMSLSNSDREYLDISINRTIIEILYSYVSNMVFVYEQNKKRR